MAAKRPREDRWAIEAVLRVAIRSGRPRKCAEPGAFRDSLDLTGVSDQSPISPEVRGVARILLVEDDEALARGLIKVLHARGFSADHAGNGDHALMMAADEPYVVIILDIGLPDISGFDVLKTLRARGNKVPILMLTARDRVQDRVFGLDLGADDYLLKPFDADELTARLRALMRRPVGDPVPVIQIGCLGIDRSNCTATVDGKAIELRRREWMLLESLVAQLGKVVSKERLSAEIFSFEDTVSPNVIELYVGRLRRKLGPRSPAIKTVRGLGYIMENT